MPSKVVSVLCALQVFMIIGGFLPTCMMMKVYDKLYPKGEHFFTHPYPMELTEWVRLYGLWLLVIPAGWCLIAAWRSEATEGVADISAVQLAAGLILTIGVGGVMGISFLDAVHAVSGN